MHEMTIAVNIVDIALQTARAADAQKINTVTVEVGALSGVEPEALEFCFSEACRGTAAQNAKLELILIPAKAHCSHCGNTFETNHFLNLCPQCGQEVIASGGQELKVKTINVD